MPNRRRLITLGLVTFTLGVILFFPARVAYQWFAPVELKAGGISGSVWLGSAREASVSGVYLRDLTWRFRPFELIFGKIGYTVRSDLASGFIEGDIGFGITGNLVGSDINAALQLQGLQSALGIPGLQGGLSAKISELEIANGVPVAIDGVANVSRLIVPMVQRDSLGGFKAVFSTQDTGVVASVDDDDAIIDIVAGSLNISADRSYRFLAQLAVNEKTPAPLRDQMQFIGNEVRLEGVL